MYTLNPSNRFGSKSCYEVLQKNSFPVGIYLLKFNNRNTKKRCEICLKLTIKTPERRHTSYFTPCSNVSVVNFGHVIAGWVAF